MHLFLRQLARFLRLSQNAGLAICVVLLSAIAVSAASLDDYRQRVESVHSFVEELLAGVDTSEQGKRDVRHENDVAAHIRRVLPPTEKVEWPNGSVETANEWLFASLEQFQNEEDPAKRGLILTSINERLASIAREVDLLQKAAASHRTKDEDKQKLAEILQREEYQKAQAKQESLFQKWLREFMEWLAKVFPRTPATPSSDPGTGSLKIGLQILIFALVIGLVGFLIYKFVPIFGRRGRKKKKEKGDRVILGERVTRDESAASLFDEAELLAREGNLRGAIRKGYIAMLCELSDRKLIGLARHKTNRDYLRDVRKRADLFENMNGMTLNFERNWYGLRPTDEQDWEDFKNRYRQTIAGVKG